MELDQFRDVDLVIDYANYSFIEKQFVSQGDYKGRTLTVQVTNNGVVGEVPGLMLNLNWHNEASGLSDLSAFSVLNKANSIYRIEYPQHMMTPGKVLASVQVIQNGKVTNLKQFELTVQELAGQPVGIVEKAEFSALVAVLADSNKFRSDIESLELIKADKSQVDVLISDKVDKSGAGQVRWANIAQDAREQISGGKTAVVGTDSVLTESIVDGVVTQSKLGFSPYNKLSFQKANFNTEEYCGFDKNGNYMITKDASGQVLHNYRLYAQQNGVGQAVRVVGQHINATETTKAFLGVNENEIIFANLLQNQVSGNYDMEFHMISRGALVTNIFPKLTNIADSATVRLPHSLTLRQIGNYLAVYFNETLIQIINSKTYLGSQFSVSGTNYRGTFNSGVSRVRTIFAENAISPYMHMSIDDVNSILRDIHDNRASYTSIFDNANLAFLKSMHEKYGIVVSLYLFKATSSFDISNMTSKYRVEFADNAHWLKLGFHSRESGVNYNETDSATLIADYTSVVNAIYTFAVPANLDVIPRFENFGVSLANQKALLASGQPFEGTYGADDSRDLSAGLTGNALTLIQNTDYYFDPKLQLYYPRSETRMDSATSESIVSQLNVLSRNVANNRVFGMFWHQGAELRAEQQAAIETAAEWAVDHQIRFDFPQNNKPTL